MTPCDAVIFDLDGTLIETEGAYRQAFYAAAAALGVAMPAGLYGRLVGIATPDRAAILRASFGPAFPLDRFFAAYYARRDALLAEGVPVQPGLHRLLRQLSMPKAVATSASRRTASAHLQRAGLAAHFRHVVTRDDVARGKPAPDGFLLAAERLGVAPARCIAVEDSAVGQAAAAAAGMRVLVVGPDGIVPVLHVLLAGTPANVHTLTAP